LREYFKKLHDFVMPASAPTIILPRVPLAEWASLHAHLVWVYDGPVSFQGRSGKVSAFDLTAWLIRHGQVEVRLGEQTWRAGPHEWLFPPPGERWQNFSADARILSVRFRAKWPTGEDLLPANVGGKIPAARCPDLLRAAVPLARFVQRHFPRAETDLMQAPAALADYLRLQTLFSRWLETVITVLTEEGLIPAHMGKIDDRLLSAVRRLERQSLASPVNETTLARSVGLSVSQLNRLFLRQFGVSSRGYFDRRRHQHALTALGESTRGAKEIASNLGFSSLPHFSAWFRRKQGVSPREFRSGRGGGLASAAARSRSKSGAGRSG
jgi:AraC-like DNA-binding protein